MRASCRGCATPRRWRWIATCGPAPVDEQRIAAATEALHRHLLRYSPRVEPARHEPGVFWLDAGGLQRVGGTPAAWAERLWRGLRKARFVCGVTVGFSRFGTYCLSRVHRRRR